MLIFLFLGYCLVGRSLRNFGLFSTSLFHFFLNLCFCLSFMLSTTKFKLSVIVKKLIGMKRFLVDFNKDRCYYFRLNFRSLLHVVHIVLYETIKKLYMFLHPVVSVLVENFPPPPSSKKNCVTEIFGKDDSHFSSYQVITFVR